MPDVPELRIHGVSGTHPRDMLYTDPLPRDPALPGQKRYTGVHRRRDPTDQAEAFHWGGVTSGASSTAFWLLLLPFALLNAAGWMAAQRAYRPGFVAAVRLAGLMLTGVFVIEALTVVLDLSWHRLNGPVLHGSLGWAWRNPRWAGAGLTLVAMGLFALMTNVANRSHFQHPAPAWQRIWVPGLRMMAPDQTYGPDATIAATSPSNDAMWVAHPTADRLSRIHVGFGLALIGATLATAAAGGITAAPMTAAGVILLAVVAVTVIVTIFSGAATGRGWVDHVISWLPIVSVAAAATGLVAFVTSDLSPERHLPGLHDLGFATVVIFAMSVAVIFVTGYSARPAALAILAAIVGGGLGAGLSLAAERGLQLSGALPNGLGWFAAASLFGFLLMGVVLAARFAVGSRWRLPMRALRETVAGVGVAFDVILLATVATMAAVIGLRWPNLFDSHLPPIGEPPYSPGLGRVATALFLIIAVLIGLSFAIMKRWKVVLVAIGGAALTLIVIRSGIPRTRLLGIPLDLGTFPSVAATVAVLLPASLIVTSIVGSLRNESKRRGVGILWDLAGMWPRWYHPFAPPPYGPKVVTDLQDEVTQRLRKGNLVLAAHSQGSVLAAIVTHRVPPELRAGLALLTYGSPLGSLYARFFPAHFTGTWIAGLTDDLRGDGGVRWRNLWRLTDPIGGPIPGVALEEELSNVRDSHSRYELEDAYGTARDHLSHLLPDSPPVPSPEGGR